MRFKLPAPLLAQLQQRREAQRAQRVSRDSAPAHEQPSSLVGTLQDLLDSERGDVNRVAADYVSGMHDLQDQIEREHDAFLLDPGMGPMAYLATDGRVLLDFRAFDGAPLREADDDEAIATLVVGAKKTGISGLLALVPDKPVGAAVCVDCKGTRWMTVKDINREDFQLLCPKCRGRGWQPG
jgi:hypothetical protein